MLSKKTNKNKQTLCFASTIMKISGRICENFSVFAFTVIITKYLFNVQEVWCYSIIIPYPIKEKDGKCTFWSRIWFSTSLLTLRKMCQTLCLNIGIAAKWFKPWFNNTAVIAQLFVGSLQSQRSQYNATHLYLETLQFFPQMKVLELLTFCSVFMYTFTNTHW